MLAYNGTEPYVFFSYSHADTELVEKIIIELRQRLCRVWFDEGLTPGESFNDELAERIINCECFVVALTEHSVFSNYVKAEINYSVSKGKKIIALIIDNTDIPPGIDIMISPYQHIQFNSETDHKKMTEVLSDALPDKVFSTRKVPFLEYGKFEFYLEKNDIQFDDPLGRDIRRNEFEIICVAEMERSGRLDGVITQNIDGLHQKAGSKNVQEIHGTIWKNHCVSCGEQFDENFVFDSPDPVPRCPKCGKIVRPDVTLYGEYLPQPAYSNAIDMIGGADCLIIGGTSLEVGSAAQLAHMFHGNHLVIINKGKTRMEGAADLVFHDSISKVLEKIR